MAVYLNGFEGAWAGFLLKFQWDVLHEMIVCRNMAYSLGSFNQSHESIISPDLQK